MSRIGLDLDGVLADFNHGYIDLIRTELGIQLPKPSATYPDVWNYERAAGITSSQENKLWNRIKTSEFWGTLHPLQETPYVLDVLSRLRFGGHDIYFITSRPGQKSKLLSERWLSLSGMNNPTVLTVKGEKEKGFAAKALQLDIFIDDKPENLYEAVREWPKVKAYLLDQPYNQEAEMFLPGERFIIRVPTVTKMLELNGLLPEQLKEAA